MRADIDRLVPEVGLMQLSSDSMVDMQVDDFKLKRLHGDILLCEFTDVSEDGEYIKRGGLLVPLHAQTKAWRKAEVVLVGTDAKWSAVGEVVMFPNNYGVEVHNIEVCGYGKIKNAVFLNESRIFGVCEPRSDESNKS
jgi:cellobiose-specific phosphotransferase system component IIB